MRKITKLNAANNRRQFESAAKPALAFALLKRAAASGTLVLFLAIDGGPLGLPSVRIPIRFLRSTLSANLRWLASGPLFVATVADEDEPAFLTSPLWAKVRPFALALRMGATNPLLITPLDYESAVGLGFNLTPAFPSTPQWRNFQVPRSYLPCPWKLPPRVWISIIPIILIILSAPL
jgi:hypothetical protein